ncbi:MAG: glycosyltransferase, partial [Pseudomonadota bacterium]
PHVPDGIPLHVAGTVWDEQERAALDSPRVTYLGKLDQDELWRRQRDALCVIVPNIEEDVGQFEGFGLVAVEAAAAGGVVLAARHGGIVEAVQDQATGFLLTPGDAQAWADKISEVAGWSAATRTGFIASAQQICASHYSWARVARDTAAHYLGDDGSGCANAA